MRAAQCPAAAYYTKWIIAVDEDVDPTDFNEVMWALSTRCHPADDIDTLRNTWSGMCGTGTTAPPPEFRNVYPFVTTVKGNRFQFRGGDPNAMRDSMQKLFQGSGGGVKVRVEE